MTIIGAAGLGISGGWTLAGPTVLHGRLLLALPAAGVPGAALAVAGLEAGIGSLIGLLLGLGSRLLLDLSLTHRQPNQGGSD